MTSLPASTTDHLAIHQTQLCVQGKLNMLNSFCIALATSVWKIPVLGISLLMVELPLALTYPQHKDLLLATVLTKNK